MFDNPVVLILVALAVVAVFLIVRSNGGSEKDRPKGVIPKPYGRAANGKTSAMPRPLPETPAERRMSGSFHHTRPQDRETLAQAQRRREEEERRRRDVNDIPMTDVRHPLYHTLYGMPAHEDRSSRADDRSCDDNHPSHTAHDDRPAYCPDPTPSHSYGGSSSSYGGSDSSSPYSSDSSSSSSSSSY